jgi:hypothetical protein
LESVRDFRQNYGSAFVWSRLDIFFLLILMFELVYVYMN